MSARIVTVALILMACAWPVAAQTPSLQSDLIKDWTNQQELMAKIADAMPEDKFSFKATPAQRTFVEQITHVAGANIALFKALGAKAAAPSPDLKATSKVAVLKALNDSYAFGLAVLQEQTEASLLQAVQGPAFLGSSTRARIAYFVMNHAMDIYGQMAVYLRLNGIVPPASRSGI